jgi:hypothetical protein
MRRLCPNNRRRRLLTRLMLGLLLVRAYIPAGFMPQGGNPLQLQICSPGTSIAVLLRDRQTTGNAAHGSDCPFNHSPVGGPVFDAVMPVEHFAAFSLPLVAFDTRPAGVTVLCAHRARAPPALA